MADDLKNSKTISKKDTSFPDYLDFDTLRTEGITYLGKLSGQIWTDHNVHDPGITILEMLCYALLDLGYRTNLPQEDIFTRNPEDKTQDNNFFTPAQILTCNPLTITDFRKLLIDIEDVRNAWLEPATDVTDFCRPRQQDPAGFPEGEQGNLHCVSFLNGLYHVYLDLEKDIDSYGEINSDFENEENARAYKEKVIEKVKIALMAHRNLCEDFEDIFILCKQPMGVCADIDLEENAVADQVYLAVVEELRNFFTPAPRFYTLQQLLEKQKPIEAIFAGRPYNITQSHGFVDTAELELLKLKKEIHLSDVYNVLFSVPGVRSVRNLSLRLCENGSSTSGWKFPVKKNHIPEYSIRCSGFQFTRNGMPVTVDFKKYLGLFDLNFSHSGKVLYQSPSPYLDTEIPKGVYRNDLTQYNSIQHEFPRVYGIEEGGLSDDAPALRKAQALQLKGYLLFFDQLLANYLSQLGNIRSLFALSSQKNEEEQHTYFMNQLSTVPELQKLLRFQANENGENHSLGAEGSTLVFPVDKNTILSLKESEQLQYFDLEAAAPYVFETLTEKDIVVSQLKNDLYYEAYSCEFVTKTDDCIYYYILPASEEIALISKKYFKDLSSAKQNAASVKYIGAFDENYRSFIDSTHHFSFTIELNLASFAKYLQLVVENRELYLQRRQDFLHHLLARFAEKFTDYALLSFGNFSNTQIDEAKIQATEQFLTHYDDLSSKRGKAYDYRVNQWNNDNVSGFEKRVKALSGIEYWKRHSLCNFVVDAYEEQYAVNLKMAGQDFFTLQETYDSREEAQQAAQTFFSALADRSQYQTLYIPHEQAYAITLQQDDQTVATYQKKYENREEADTVVRHIHQTFSGNPASKEDIFISQYLYYLQLKDYSGHVVHTSAKSYDTEASVQSAVNQLKQGINDKNRWQAEEETAAPTGTLYRDPQQTETPQFIDLDAFKIDIDNTLVGKPDKYSYDVLDIRNRFKFRPVTEFDNQKQAKAHWQHLLTWMAHTENYQIQPSGETGNFTLHIVVNEEDQAVYSANFNSEEEARQTQNEILSIIRQHLYALTIQKVPFRWKFNYHLGIALSRRFTFESVDDYNSIEEALAAATGFEKSIATLQLRKYKDELRLVPIKTPEKTSSVKLVPKEESQEEDQDRTAINQEVSLQQEVNRLLERSDPEAFEASVDLDVLSKQGLFVYRLIDKDTIPAQFSKPFGDRNSADKTRKALSTVNCDRYAYLEICLGGDIISKRIDENTRIPWYHFLIRSRNRFAASGEALILFESTKGYPTEEEAQKAFTENYLQILEWASDPVNYGKIISMEEVPVHHTDDCIKSESIVFVPKETLGELGETTPQKLAALSTSYPIRLVADQSDQFYQLFPCEEKPEKRKERVCKADEQKFVYYFRLYITEPTGEQDAPPYWQSTAYYATPEEARRDFRFFLILLCYPGNFFIQCDDCEQETNTYRIYLREVLAESTAHFGSEEEAWGPEGVQKFICVSQSENAFHHYQRKEDCCYSFYVACADSLVYHPCHYDTPQKRDQAIEKLYREFSKQHKTRAYQLVEDNDNEGFLLLNEQGNPFARTNLQNQKDLCDGLLGFLGRVMQHQIAYITDESGAMYAQDDENGITVYPYDNFGGEIWKKTLATFACYFPVVKRPNEKTGKDAYCVEIKLPGFTTCGEDPEEDTPCGCYEKEVKPEPACYVAWKSRCCFPSCEEAMSAWQAMMELLLHYDNYRPLFDCDCYDFSIALHYNNLEGSQDIINREAGFALSDSEIVAVNPQCYSNPDSVCAAIERSWKLINSEGLHVTEHILLRPRCEADCQCEQYSTYCDNKTDCNFVWSEPDDDPCADQPEVCFTPGADPYSFIATVVMPAWPVRFRKTENRQLLESILYREAPAHVLLRILWLAPHDLCCFESKYKQWGRWLAHKKTCGEEFSNCDFLEFLFNRYYECLSDCDVCQPCGDEETEPDFCAENRLQKAMSDPFQYLNQINSLYCWREQYCDEYRFIPCEGEPVVDEDEDDDVILLTPLAAIPSAEEKRRSKKGSAKAKKETTKAKETPATPLKPKPQVVNSRMARYRTVVDEVVEKTARHPLAGKAQVFVKDPQPSPDRTSNLLIEIAQNKKPEDKKRLTKKQVFVLLQNSVCYYLDKVCFDGKDLEKIRALQHALEALRKAKTDMQAVYQYWDPEEVRRYEPALSLDEIKQLISPTD